MTNKQLAMRGYKVTRYPNAADDGGGELYGTEYVGSPPFVDLGGAFTSTDAWDIARQHHAMQFPV